MLPANDDYYRAKYAQADRYTLSHFAQHLHRAGQHERLRWLLTSSKAWMDAKFDRFGTHVEFDREVRGEEVD